MINLEKKGNLFTWIVVQEVRTLLCFLSSEFGLRGKKYTTYLNDSKTLAIRLAKAKCMR